MAGQSFDALILKIVLPRDRASTIELEDIRLRREKIEDQLGRERVSDLLSGEVSPTISEENLLSRFCYLGRMRDECWETLGGLEVLKRWRKDLPAIILSTQLLKLDKEMAKRFSLLGLSRSKWFDKPCDLEEVVKTLVDFFTETSPNF